MAAMESLQLKSGRWMESSVVAEFKRAYLAFRAALNLLAEAALQDGVLRYRLRPKLHQLGHLAWNFVPRNPRRNSCYQDEDFMYRTKTLAVRRNPRHVSRQVLLRYTIYVCLLYSGHVVG